MSKIRQKLEKIEYKFWDGWRPVSRELAKSLAEDKIVYAYQQGWNADETRAWLEPKFRGFWFGRLTDKKLWTELQAHAVEQWMDEIDCIDWELMKEVA